MRLIIGGYSFADACSASALTTRVFWHKSVDAGVLLAEAHAVPVRELGFDVRAVQANVVILQRLGQSQHVLFGDGRCSLRVDLTTGSLINGPVALRFRIEDDRRFPAQMKALSRFRALRLSRSFSADSCRSDPKADRWVRQLRAWDALEAGASERSIAAALFPSRAGALGWREGGEALRSSVRRLVSSARRMVDRDYLRLLH